jgi:hypothetical protein
MHRVIASPQLSAALAPAYFAHVRTYPWQTGAISAPKEDSLFRWRWLKGDPARDTEVQANALQRNWPG